MPWIYLTIAIVGEVIATSALKASNGFTNLWPSVVTTVGYAFTFYFLALTLKTIPIGVAYAIWSGLGVVLISIIGLLVFKQALDLWAYVGIGMIVGGVVVINVLSKSVAH